MGNLHTDVLCVFVDPPKPSSRPEVLVNTVRRTDFSVWFNLSSLSTKHGLLQKYALIVAEGEAPTAQFEQGFMVRVITVYANCRV